MQMYGRLVEQELFVPMQVIHRPFAAVACVDPRYRVTLDELLGSVAHNGNYLNTLAIKGGPIRLSIRHESSDIWRAATLDWISGLYQLFGSAGLDIILVAHGPDCKHAEGHQMDAADVLEALGSAKAALQGRRALQFPKNMHLRHGILVDNGNESCDLWEVPNPAAAALWCRQAQAAVR